MTAPRHDGPVRPLTPRQQEIADGIGQGKTNREIAASLGVSVATVKQYVSAMALLFVGNPELPARQRIFLWVRHEAWLAQHHPDERRTA